MTIERRNFVILHSIILCGMIVCMFFMFQHQYRHHFAFSMVFWGLLGFNSVLLLRTNRNLPQPDNVTRLFPVSIAKDHQANKLAEHNVNP